MEQSTLVFHMHHLVLYKELVLSPKGPYIRNCTNFIKDSIGAKIDGFNADEGDKVNNIGVQGSFNVDSYTQFNQGGIGVSVTNGAYVS